MPFIYLNILPSFRLFWEKMSYGSFTFALQVLFSVYLQKVYASPSRRRMDTKGEVEEITYPFLSFMVDNFDEVRRENL